MKSEVEMKEQIVKLFLRIAVAVGFLSAVADRVGWWPSEVSAWGNWEAFIAYTGQINPYALASMVPTLGLVATILEVVLALCLLVGFKTELAARISGWLLVSFAMAMASSIGLKYVFDYSVLAAAAAAFAINAIKQKHWELDIMLSSKD